MPRRRVVLARDACGTTPFLEWFAELPHAARALLRARIDRLADEGPALGPPDAAPVAAGIHELRVRHRGVAYRALYSIRSFRGRDLVVISHGIVDGRRRPGSEIRCAMRRAVRTEADPERHGAGTAALDRRFFDGRPERVLELEAARASAALARRLRAIRTRAGLTQEQLAERVGTTPSVVCRIEGDGYHGHSLAMLRRVAAALDRRVEIRFVSLPGRRRAR